MNLFSNTDSKKLWVTNLPHLIYGVVAPIFDSHTDSILVTDGWGTAFKSIRLRRLDLSTGQEMATVRTGTPVRCVAFDNAGSTLMAANDHRLMLLDRSTLAVVQEWRSKVPRYSDYIVWQGDLVLLKNWLAPALSRFDTNSSRVSRLNMGPCDGMYQQPNSDHVLILSGKEGRLSFFNIKTHKVDLRVDTPQFLNSKFSCCSNRLYLALGNPFNQTDSSISRFREAQTIRIYDLSNSMRIVDVRADQPFEDFWVSDSESQVILCNKNEIRVCEVVGSHLHCRKVTKLSSGFQVATVITERRIAIGSYHEDSRSILGAFQYGGP